MMKFYKCITRTYTRVNKIIVDNNNNSLFSVFSVLFWSLNALLLLPIHVYMSDVDVYNNCHNNTFCVAYRNIIMIKYKKKWQASKQAGIK